MSQTVARSTGLISLQAKTAADLMTPNPVSVRETAPIKDAVKLLVEKGIHAAPVIDSAGRPIGVLSATDVLRYDRAHAGGALPEYYHRADLAIRGSEPLPRGFQVEKVDITRVGEIMTPAVLSLAPESSAAYVVQTMLQKKVHRLFVVDQADILIGVISTLDVLCCLKKKD